MQHGTIPYYDLHLLSRCGCGHCDKALEELGAGWGKTETSRKSAK